MITIYEKATHLIVTGEPGELTTLVDIFRFRPDGYHFALSHQRWVVSNGEEGWDGFNYPLSRLNSTTARILRGRKDELIKHAEYEGFELDLNHLLEYPFVELVVDDVPPDIIKADFELDVNQRKCICDWLRAGIGFNKMSVGSGKTATYAGAAAMIKAKYPDARFLYVTPSERLVRQVTFEMRKFLPDFEIGQCGGGKREFKAKDMVVCTVAMLGKHFEKLKDEYLSTYIAVLYDEVHHAGSPTSMKILNAIPAYFRLGASDTGKEDDLVRYNNVRGLFGPMLNDVTSAPLISSGRLAVPHIYIVDLPEWQGKFASVPYRPAGDSQAYTLIDGEWVEAVYKGPVYELDAHGKVRTKKVKQAEKDTQDNWIVTEEPVTVPGVHLLEIAGEELQIESRWCLLNRMYDRAIIRFKARNSLIVEWVRYFHDKKWPTVVVATRTAHVYILEGLLKAALPEESVRILIGEASPTERDEAFAWLKETPDAVLVTPLVKEGVSVNAIRAMVVADYVSDYEVARQMIGRAMRPKKEDNRAHVVFFWDRQHPVLSKGCRNMFRKLEQMDGFQYCHPCTTPQATFK